MARRLAPSATRTPNSAVRCATECATTAYSAAAALDKAERLQPEIAFIDIGLPQMDGYAVARHLRSQGSSTPIIALTGYGSENARECVRENGMDGHLVKPVDADDLEAAISIATSSSPARSRTTVGS